MAELRLRTVFRIKNVSANHPAHELTVPTSVEYTFALTTRLAPSQNRSAFNLSTGASSSSDQTHYSAIHQP
jgi:hypothetical protein